MSASFSQNVSQTFFCASFLAILYGSFNKAGSFNPIVSFYLYLKKKLSYSDLFEQISAQIFASLIIGLCHFLNGSLITFNTKPVHIVYEFLGTLLLLESVHCLSLSTENRVFVPFSLFLLHEVLLPVTGCGLNPIRFLVDCSLNFNVLSFIVYEISPWFTVPIIYYWSIYIDKTEDEEESHNFENAAL
jgi:glycerol uptake facilitator-like aquaporin